MRGKLASASPCSQILASLVIMRAGGLERLEQLRRHDDVPRMDDVDAMRERRPGQVGVEQRHHAADAGDAEPDRHEFRPVRHHQADGVALADALRERPAGVAVGALGELAIAKRSRSESSAGASPYLSARSR